MAAFGQFDIAKLLLAAGADVNATIRKEYNLLRGMTPLMLAVYEGSEDLIQLLLDKGADVNAKAPNGDTALSLATDSAPKKRQGVIRMLESAATKSAPAATPRADRVSREIPVRHDLGGLVLAYIETAGIAGDARDTPLFRTSNGRTRTLTG